MPMYDLNSDERDDDRVVWTAGGESHVAVLVAGERVWRGDLQKSQRVTIAYSDGAGEDEEIKADGAGVPDHYWVECRKCGHGTVAFERYCRQCGFDRLSHRDPEYRADGGTETIDESQTVRDAVQPLLTTLRGCRRSDHCHRLAEVVTGAATVDSLGYEDLFHPLRCHREDGLVLRVEGPSGQNWLQYGSGDLFYWMTDDERTMESAVDPFELWDAIEPGSVEVEPVLVEDTPFGEDDDGQ